ncbi:zinc finger protein 586-like [Belonocnema kinseyi]|uniref:zinc finger protein 586-like n=1 Tax=Belonocnema kinseyi TaxID=2817044 RepID=UPI00143DB08E|nr:zinc finger protein 586-like [Belonocnema kinseyi]
MSFLISIVQCTLSKVLFRRGSRKILSTFFQIMKWNSTNASESMQDNPSEENSRYRLHLNERKKYECLNCSRRFTQKTTIMRHLRYFCLRGHQYKCPYCDIKGSCSSNIYRHVRARHTGREARAIKLFSSMDPRTGQIFHQRCTTTHNHFCPFCYRGFTLRKNMLRHLRLRCPQTTEGYQNFTP